MKSAPRKPKPIGSSHRGARATGSTANAASSAPGKPAKRTARRKPARRPATAAAPSAAGERTAPREPTRRRAAANDGEHVVIGEVGRPVGLAGEVRVWLHNPETEQLEQEAPIELCLPSGASRSMQVVELRYAGEQAVVRFDGVESREEAEALRGGLLRVPRASLAEPDEGEFYVWDLERCRVTLGGEPLGRVARVVPYPTCDVIEVERSDGSRVEVPLHEDFVHEIRLADSVIDLRTIDGLA